MLEDSGLVAVLTDKGNYEYQVTRPKVLEEIDEEHLIFADGTEGIEDAANEMFSKAQERKNTPVYSGFIKYFPNAIKEVKKNKFPNAVVGHAWFHKKNTEAVIAEQASFDFVKGIRSKPSVKYSKNYNSVLL